jgi:proteic killer suppression protein
VVKSFKDKETEKIYHRRFSKKYSPDIQRIALRKLRMLNNSQNLQDLRSPPGNRLEKLRGARAGQHSIRINEQWRICFVWRAGDAFEVEIADYH